MKSVLPCLLLTLAAAAVAQDSSPSTWKPFTPPGSQFTVLLPGTPVAQKQKVKTAGGEVEVTLYVLEIKGEGTFAVGFSELSAESARPGLEQRRLDNARDNVVNSAKGKLLQEKRVTLAKKFPGRELEVEAPKGAYIATRLYAVHNRLYQLLAIGPRSWVESKDTARVFDSLQLGK